MLIKNLTVSFGAVLIKGCPARRRPLIKLVRKRRSSLCLVIYEFLTEKSRFPGGYSDDVAIVTRENVLSILKKRIDDVLKII